MRVGNYARLALAIGTLAACTPEPASEKRKPADLPELATIETLAERDCSCRMAGHDATAIERELDRLTAGLSREVLGTASLPLSSTVVCYPELGDRACITEGITLASSNGARFVCTDAQAAELESVWNRALPEGGDTTTADAALAKRLAAMRSELKETLPASECQRV